MKTAKIKTIISAALLVCLLASITGPAGYAAPGRTALNDISLSELIIPDDALTINSLTELYALSDMCRIDNWSQGRSVVLMCDIDVSNSDFVPVPSFGGTFYGNGHTISGLSVKGSYSPAGLFLELQPGALVRDLTVTGTVLPSGKANYTGGIVGRNGGMVLNCRFIGSVSGNNDTGGIVGCNLATGVVSLCRVEGSVVGMNMTGGIAGLNEGTILGCESECRVNNVSVDPSITLDEINLSLDLSDLSSIGKHENVPLDTGGIAGYSTGSILACTSLGVTGYPHVGYNVGGIAGRNCGYINGSTAKGTVYGRKDIGGIVGQAEPWKQEVISESDVAVLQGQITAMQATINQLQQDASNAGVAVTEELTNFSDLLVNVYDSLHNITTSVNVSMPNMQGIMDKYFPEGIGSGSGSSGNTGSDSGTSVPPADSGSSSGSDSGTSAPPAPPADTGSGGESSAPAAAAETSGGAAGGSAAPVLPATLADTDGGTSVPPADAGSGSGSDSGASAAPAPAADSGSGTSGGDSGTSAPPADTGSGSGDGGTSNPPAPPADTGSGDSGTSNPPAPPADSGSGSSDSGTTTPPADSGSGSGSGDSGDSGNTGAGDIINGIIDDINSGSVDIGAVTEQINRENVESALAALDEYAAGISASGTTDLSGVRNAVLMLTDGVNSVNDAYTGHSTVIDADLALLTQQVTGITETINSILYGENAGSTIVDVSLVNPDIALLGKVGHCVNYANVEGDYNVGGIVGTQANESSIDPEDDLTVKIDNAITKEYDLVVLCTDCINYGTVTAKMDYCGGIAGRIGLGAILRCESYGIVRSISGDYVGGIAGQNSATIRRSYAKCILGGESYVGGITGYTTDKNTDGGSGEVSSCISMINIINGQKYCGAVSGCESGEISGNVFVSDTLCGFNYVSKAGEAEPVSYERLVESYELPEDFLTLRVYFMCDDRIIDIAEKSYGDELVQADIPAVPAKSENYGAWSVEEGLKVYSDIIALGEYTPYTRTLASGTLRDDGRNAFYVQGIFAPEAIFKAVRVGEIIPKSELPFKLNITEYGAEIVEQWILEIPDDGSDEHIVRYRTPNGGTEHIRIFTKTDFGWQQLETEAQGTYLLFKAPAGNSEIVVLSSATITWMVIIGIIVGILLLIVLIFIIAGLHRRRKARKLKKAQKSRIENSEEEENEEKTAEESEARKAPGKAEKIFGGIIKAIVITALSLIMLAFAVIVIAPDAVAGVLGGFYLSRLQTMDEREMILTVDAYEGSSEFSLESEIYSKRLPAGETISCVSTRGINLYYCDGVLFLENGNAYSLNGLNGSIIDSADAAISIFKGTSSTMKRDGGYTVISTKAESADAKAILAMVFPEIADSLHEVGMLDVTLYVLNQRISYITFTGSAITNDNVQFGINAKLQVVYNSDARHIIPEAVLAANETVRSGGETSPLKLNADMLSLLSVWGSFNQRPVQAASISLKASSTILSVSSELEWFRKEENGTKISCVGIGSAKFYMTDEKMCTENGGSISIDQLNNLSAASLIDTAFMLSQSVVPEVSEQNGASVYSIALTGAQLKDIAETLLPQLKDMSLSLSAGNVSITVKNGSIAAISVYITGEINTLIDIPLNVSASAVINNYITDDECTIPAGVISALAG